METSNWQWIWRKIFVLRKYFLAALMKNKSIQNVKTSLLLRVSTKCILVLIAKNSLMYDNEIALSELHYLVEGDTTIK